MLDILIAGFFLYQILMGWSRGLVCMIFRILITIVSALLPYPLIKLVRTNGSSGFVFLALYFLLAFFIYKLLNKLILRFAVKLNKIPILGSINRLLGSVAGFGYSFFITYLGIYLLKIISIFSVDIRLFMEQSKLLPFFNNIF